MRYFEKSIFSRGIRLLLGPALLLCLCSAGCNHAQKVDTQPLDNAGMWADSVAELRNMSVSSAEIAELAQAREAGLSDSSCVMLIKLARSRQKPFSDGQVIADLLSAGSSEQTVLALARLNQLSIWGGQAQVLRLAGLSDSVILAVARRRAQNMPVLSGEKLGELKNAGADNSEILEMVQQGITDQEASYYISQKERGAGGHSFVYQGRRKRS